MLARNIQNKTIGWLIENGQNHNAPIGSQDCEPLIQQIAPIDSAAGNTEQQRMGDRVKPKSLKVKGIVSLNTAYPAASAQPLYVRILILSQKDIKVGSAVLGGSVDTSNLLLPAFAGTGNDQAPFAGTTQDLLYPVNKQKFRVYMDKVIKLTPTVSASAKEANPGYCAKYSYRFKSLPTSLTYDDGSGDWANNFAPFICMGYAYSDSSTETEGQFRVQHSCYSTLEFEDA